MNNYHQLEYSIDLNTTKLKKDDDLEIICEYNHGIGNIKSIVLDSVSISNSHIRVSKENQFKVFIHVGISWARIDADSHYVFNASLSDEIKAQFFIDRIKGNDIFGNDDDKEFLLFEDMIEVSIKSNVNYTSRGIISALNSRLLEIYSSDKKRYNILQFLKFGILNDTIVVKNSLTNPLSNAAKNSVPAWIDTNIRILNEVGQQFDNYFFAQNRSNDPTEEGKPLFRIRVRFNKDLTITELLGMDVSKNPTSNYVYMNSITSFEKDGNIRIGDDEWLKIPRHIFRSDGILNLVYNNVVYLMTDSFMSDKVLIDKMTQSSNINDNRILVKMPITTITNWLFTWNNNHLMNKIIYREPFTINKIRIKFLDQFFVPIKYTNSQDQVHVNFLVEYFD